MDRGGYRGRGGGRTGHRGGRGRAGGGGGRPQQQDHHQQPRRSHGYEGFQGTQSHPRPHPPANVGTSHGDGSRRGTGGAVPAWGRPGGQGRDVCVPSTSEAPMQPPRDPVPQPIHDSLEQKMQSVTLAKELLPSSSTSTPGDSSKMFPVSRPDKGGTSAIRTTRLRVNHFLVEFNADSTILHYDVDIKPEGLPRNGRPVKISKSNMALIRTKLFTDNPAKLPLLGTAYDGEKNIFSLVPLEEGVYEVELSDEEGLRKRAYKFTIKLVNELKLGKLNDYLIGHLRTMPSDILQGMNVVMKENPTRSMIPVGRTFHSRNVNRDDDLGFGLRASRGYQYNLKLTSQGLALCSDYCVMAFRKHMPVIDFLNQHVHRFSLTNFSASRSAVASVLKNLKVTVTHRRTQQKYTIAGLTKHKTKDIIFPLEDPDGRAPTRQIRIVDYFREKYGIDIVQKDIPCLEMAGKSNRMNYVPMEFCVLAEGQIYPKELLDKDTARRLKDISLANPGDRESRICNTIEATYGRNSGSGLQNFGVDVDLKMTSVIGRVIQPPELKLGANNGQIKVTVDKNKCQWNLLGKGLVEGKRVERWAVLDFSSSDRWRLDPNIFIPKLIKRCQTLGMHMEEPVAYQCTGMDKLSNIDALSELLESFTNGAYKNSVGHLQFILCVMSRRDPGYKYLKWISETRIGVVTQCCLSTSANRVQDQYLANLALKINAKLGGSNVELIDALPHFKREDYVMFVGADVNHPAALNATSPSIAAVVGSVNWPTANRYAARIRDQNHRKERIMNFGSTCLDLVETYAGLNNGRRPKKILVFRDGVSEGQFDMVLNEELVEMKMEFGRVGYTPDVTVVVAQKRHQTRFFLEGGGNRDSNGNVPPGTVVDTKVIHPFEFDFYLCSHYGSLGTSKPTHYHVLWDENGFSSDGLQKLIYNMCFTFARCTKPVSLVPPVYYADLAAYRGRMYHEAVMEGRALPSAAASSFSFTQTSSDEFLDEKFYKVHPGLKNMMFFV